MADSSQPWTEPSSSPLPEARAEGSVKTPALRVGRSALARWNGLAPAAWGALRLGAVALAGSWLGYYLITPLPYIDLEAFRATILLHLVTGLVLVPYLVSLVVDRRLPSGSALDAPLVALLGVYLLTTATSLDWRVSLETALTALMAAGVFYVLSDGRLLRRWQVEMALMLAVLAAALKALWVVGDDYLDWLRLTDAVRGSLSWGDLLPPTVLKVHDVGDHPNILGAILATSLPFFLVTAFRPVPIALRLLAALAAVAVLLAIFLSLARSAWLAAAVATLITAALLLGATAGGRALLRRLRPATPKGRMVAGVLAVVLAAGVLGAAYLAQSVEARPMWLFRESGTPRRDVLEAGAEMVRDYPLLGTGPGVYALLYPEYSGRYPNHAFHSHNGYLQAAIDMGIPGVAAMLALAGALGWLLLRGLRETEGDARLSLVACAGSFAAFATFSLLDAPNQSKGALVTLAAVGAIAVLSHNESRRMPGAGGNQLRLTDAVPLLARMVVPIALAGLLITWGRLDIAHFYYSNGLGNANAGRWPEAAEQAERAVELDPQFAVYHLQLGAVQAQAYLETGDPALLDEAVGALERGLELEPRSAIGHVNLALLLAEVGQREEARSEALAALRFANSDLAVVLAAATALEAADWDEDAVEAYAQALYLDLGLADSPFWRGNSFRRTHFQEIVGRSALVFNPCALLRLATLGAPAGPLTGDEALAACAQQVTANPGDEGGKVALAEALIERGGLDEAYGLLDQVLTRQPDFGPARTALGRWYAARGDLDAAREQWLRAAQLDEVEALVLLGDSYPPGEVPPEVADALRSELREAASQVQFHLTGILYYRLKFFRASPIQILLPGEWQEAVPGRYDRAQQALARWTE